MKHISVSFLLIIGLFVSPDDTFPHEYYPHFVGNRWRLKSRRMEERVIKIARKDELFGLAVNVLQRQAQGRVDELWIASSKEGIHLFRAKASLGVVGPFTFDYDPPEMLIPSPLTVGTTWEVKGQTTFNRAVIKASTLSTVVAMESVRVPAGTFQDCLQIRQDHVFFLPFQISLTGTIWLAKDVGVVKEKNTSGVIFELVEYELFYPWDINRDKRVDVLDLVLVANRFGERTQRQQPNSPDINSDGRIDILDLVLVARRFGEVY